MTASLQKILNEINSRLAGVNVLARYSGCSTETAMLELDDTVEKYCGYVLDLNRAISSILNDASSFQEKLIWYNNLISIYNHFVAKTECFDGTSIEEVLRPIFYVTEDFIDNIKSITKL
ncbi:MAG: hypothetical protein K2G41_02615 [Duncaniella sp.]|uniref:hypothetical protein n=1 Tax=Duncaniella sp. TaxID=2518496 RepID=UPI0023C4CB68|nr:hypothetical protein [Duncaniella sp.]MDE6089570.1 hypothetical protein [Duncaniella sp.]